MKMEDKLLFNCARQLFRLHNEWVSGRVGEWVKKILFFLPLALSPFLPLNSYEEDVMPSLSEKFQLMRVYDSFKAVDDKRLKEVRHVNFNHTFTPYTSQEAWLAKAKELKEQILISTGLWPMPEKSPLNAKVFNKIEHEDYTVEKVYFESYSGFYVTGNLYKPKGKKGPFPGIINPHGHWGNGRLENSELGSIPGRCINFAKQGYVAFSYDMVGYNDSAQLDHKFGGDRQTLWGINLLALQLYNSIRSIDFITSLPDVDPERIGCTGASGGGTQTFILTAVDERIKVSAPVNMISAHMQGGCLCENAPNLRLDTFNIEIGAMMAPRPLLLVSATGDWTKNTPEVEYPAIRSIYKLFNAEDKVKNVHIDAPHNYNKASREAVYAWFGKWFLGIDDERQFKEQPFEVEKREDLLVFHGLERPSKLDANSLTENLIQSAKSQLEHLKPKDRHSLNKFKELMYPGLHHSLAAINPRKDQIVVEKLGEVKGSNFRAERLILGRKDKGDRVPAIVYLPLNFSGKAAATLIVHPDGKSALVDVKDSSVHPLVKGLLDKGQMVLAIDTFLTGEFNTPYAATGRDLNVNFFTTYNRTDVSHRVQDILTALSYLQSREDVDSANINLIGMEQAGLWCLLARGLASNVNRTVIDTNQFDNQDDESFLRELYVPSIRRLGDFFTAAALTAPGMLYIHNTGERFRTNWLEDVYQAAGAPENLRLFKAKVADTAVIGWLKP
jgi:cephalosporin-C deacetylase-like acetyl esterase